MGTNEEQSENGPLDIRNDFEMGIMHRCGPWISQAERWPAEISKIGNFGSEIFST